MACVKFKARIFAILFRPIFQGKRSQMIITKLLRRRRPFGIDNAERHGLCHNLVKIRSVLWP